MKLGRLLRAERECRGLTQQRLASQAGVTSQQVSLFEAGRQQPTTRLMEAMFGALGLQLRVDVEQLDSELDIAMERAASDGPQWCESLLFQLQFMRDFGKDAPRMILDGPLAACLLGLPIKPERIDILVAEHDLDMFAGWISRQLNISRYNERSRDYSGYRSDPRLPGRLQWATPTAELAAKLMAVLPEPVVVRLEEREVEVRPLLEVIADHPDVARVVGRCRKRSLH